jgi:Na+-driven multidrug efflux pump
VPHLLNRRAGLIFTFADSLGIAVYGSAEASSYIKIFALLAPVMYMDLVIDGCLKGLGQMMYSMGINICEAVIGVVRSIPCFPGMPYPAISA